MRILRIKFLNLIFIITFIILIITVAFYITWTIQDHKVLPAGGVRQFNRELLGLGPLKIGGDIPLDPKPEEIQMPRDILHAIKFYVNVVQSKFGCTLKYCNIEAAIIDTLGGWLEAEETRVTIDELVGLDLEENKNVKSIVIIGDQKGKIVGIFPNKTLNDVIPILKFYPKLANFDVLRGVDEFGFLKVGKFAPLKPGDSVKDLSEKLINFSTYKIPKGKQFYMYVLQKNNSGGDHYLCEMAGCKYLEIADIIFDSTDDLNGWFLANDNDNSNMAELFELKQEDILSGKSSLVVLTDSKGVIVDIHPQKTLSDAITILSQHPEIVNLEEIYNKY